MTAAAFQSVLARLIVDADFRRRVRRDGAAALRGRPLSDRERDRLLAGAADPGMEVTATLPRGCRPSKLLGRLPLTFTLLDPATSRRELAAFWAARPPAGFDDLDEAIAFCDHLIGRAEELRVPYLCELAAYERAGLELQRPRPAGEEAPLQWVELVHDPLPLIAALADGRVPPAVAPRRCFLVGRRIGDETEWRLAEPITEEERPAESAAGGGGG